MDDKQVVKVQTDAGEVVLTPSIVRKFLVNGNGALTDQEVQYFLALCKFQRLNPFVREAYIIKYGNNNPASIVVGKEAFTKRARKLGAQWTAGVILSDGNGELRRTNGVTIPALKLVGGWATVKDRDGNEFDLEVPYDEYEGRKQDGTPNRQWKEKPATMIRKVALCQALREAFPSEFGGMYSPEEMSHVDATTLPDAPVQTVEVEVKEPPRRGRPPKVAEPDPIPEPPIIEVGTGTLVECPQREGDKVYESVCAECSSREGCPSHE